MREIRFIHRKGKPRVRAIALAGLLLFTAWLTVVLNTVNAVMPVSTLADGPKVKLDHPLNITPTPKPEYTQEDIENYMRIIFGPQARVAIAIQHDECNPNRPDYPHCVNHSNIEYSIGLMQINLKNKTQMIHFYRVPGNTLEEKIAWLQNPYNNVLFAYWVYSTSGFHPWTTYLNGHYLNNL